MQALKKEAQDPHLWDNPERGADVKRKISSLRDEIDMIESLRNEIDSIEEFLQLELDAKTEKELAAKIQQLQKKLSEKEILVYLSGKWDKSDAIMEIHSGAGGRDAEDWAAMLLRMYIRYAESKGFTVKNLDTSYGEAGGPEGRIGIKHVTVKIFGRYAYGYLKNETGVHRLVRQSPFSEKDLRHTSFAKVEVLPDFGKETEEIELKDDDLDISTFKSSGPGGQNVNKRETAVRVSHKPTGITVSCQSERSQGKNKMEALHLLKAKLYEKKQKEKKAKIKNARDDSSASWGNQIRNYVLHPYKLVKDTRTDVETSDVESVLEGGLNQFIDAEIKLND